MAKTNLTGRKTLLLKGSDKQKRTKAANGIRQAKQTCGQLRGMSEAKAGDAAAPWWQEVQTTIRKVSLIHPARNLVVRASLTRWSSSGCKNPAIDIIEGCLKLAPLEGSSAIFNLVGPKDSPG